jgi:hypothetical protein
VIGRAVVGIALALVACDGKRAPEAASRVRIELVSPGEIRLVPEVQQLPNCLAFTASDAGVVRLLTMNEAGAAAPCPAGQPIGGVSFRIPKQEGHVRIIVVFADTAVESRAIAAEVRELATRGKPVTGMDLRAPGNVAVGTIDFTP